MEREEPRRVRRAGSPAEGRRPGQRHGQYAGQGTVRGFGRVDRREDGAERQRERDREDQAWDLGAAHHADGGAAQPLRPVRSVRPQHDDVGLGPARLLPDRLVGRAVRDAGARQRVRFEPRLAQVLRQETVGGVAPHGIGVHHV
jgi:hypothetical protein